MRITLEQKIQYNISSARDRGWNPTWFGLDANAYNQELIEKIEEFQEEYDIMIDGMIGPSTWRRLYTYVSRHQSNYDDKIEIDTKSVNYISYKGRDFPLYWSKFIRFDDDNGLSCRSRVVRGREPKYFVNHWDACLSSLSCHKVLERRRLGVHFLIGGGPSPVIYQLTDLENVCYHASGHNKNSVGVEINTPYSLKYQDDQIKRYGKPRPIVNDAHVHGRGLKSHLGFYKEQLDALSALWAAVSYATGIPLQIPRSNYVVDTMASAGEFSGFCAHYHLTKRKIDPASLNMADIQERAILIKLQCYNGGN